MNRPRPGSNGPRRSPGPRSNKARTALRNVPPPTARRGVNSQKTDKAKQDRTRARRTGIFRRAWVIARTLILASLVTGGLGAAGVAGWRAFQSNGFLALRQVDVIGNKLVGKTVILEKAGLELGTKLPSVPVGLVEASLRGLPGIGEVEVRRIFPSRIEIRVKEKEPVAMGYARGWYGLAPDGSRIAGLDWGQSDLPVIDGFAALDTAARAAIGGFLDAARSGYPALFANFSQMSLRGPDGLEIVLRDGRLKVLLGLDVKALEAERLRAAAGKPTNRESNKSLNSLEFLQALMAQQGAALDAGKTVDLRVEGYAYVR
ncbi:MAG: Polypeptide-transport-associated domain protein FtsQ-type [Fibrobacteres bacterium]|nr:Polypeptide-transport-associated domain protein FtsQ-type [Fibrobacterota bacterium]